MDPRQEPVIEVNRFSYINEILEPLHILNFITTSTNQKFLQCQLQFNFCITNN